MPQISQQLRNTCVAKKLGMELAYVNDLVAEICNCVLSLVHTSQSTAPDYYTFPSDFCLVKQKRDKGV